MSGLPRAVVKQAENFRVREFVKIESHPHQEALQADLQQNNVYNPFSDDSKAMIRDMDNVELFELCETTPKVQCSQCLLHCNQGIVYCMGKHSVYTHFPKDRNCEICQRPKMTRAPCRRRIGGAVHRAENFGDLITADHKVLSEGCDSRYDHRYAVVVQDLATQWIQSYPCKTKISQETQRSLQKFMEPNRKPKIIYSDNSLEFGKACEDLSWNHCTSTPHRSETHGIAERSVRRVKEGTSAVLLQSGLD